MGIDVAGLVNQAFGIAKALVPDAMPVVTIRDNPTVSVNPVTDTETTAWGINLPGVEPIQYGDRNERESQPAETNLRSFAFAAPALAPWGAAAFTQNAEIITPGGQTWQVYRVEPDPTGNLIIFHTRR